MENFQSALEKFVVDNPTEIAVKKQKTLNKDHEMLELGRMCRSLKSDLEDMKARIAQQAEDLAHELNEKICVEDVVDGASDTKKDLCDKAKDAGAAFGKACDYWGSSTCKGQNGIADRCRQFHRARCCCQGEAFE